jgi:hypothetical protein
LTNLLLIINSTAYATATTVMMTMTIIQLNSLGRALANPITGSHLCIQNNNNNSIHLSNCLATVIKLNIDKHDKWGGGEELQ